MSRSISGSVKPPSRMGAACAVSILPLTGSALGKAQLRTATTLDEIRRRLVEWAEANPDSPYVLGTSFLFDALPNNEPTRQMLDDLFPDRPVFIDSFDLHCGWVNSVALTIIVSAPSSLRYRAIRIEACESRPVETTSESKWLTSSEASSSRSVASPITASREA